jgi:hypothetical protein
VKYSRDRDIDEKARELVRAGWVPTKRGAHWRIQHPSGINLTIPGTPSDRRAALNFAADVRRALRRIEKAEAAYAAPPWLRRQGGFVPIYIMLPLAVLAWLVICYIGFGGFSFFVAPWVDQ